MEILRRNEMKTENTENRSAVENEETDHSTSTEEAPVVEDPEDGDETRTAERVRSPYVRRRSEEENPFNHMQRKQNFKPETFNEEDNTVEVIFSKGARILRMDWWTGEKYYEELSMKRSEVRLDRLNNGAAVLDNHDSWRGLESQIGVVESAQIKNKEGIAKLRLTKRESKAGIIGDIRDGVIRNISVGYRVHDFEEKTAEDGLRIFRATDWEPFEISPVTIPADPGAQVRGEGQASENLYTRGDEPMKTEPNKTPEAPENNQASRENEPQPQPQVDVEKVRAEAVEAERKRVSEITEIVHSVKLGDDVARELINKGVTVEEARKDVLSRLAKTDEENPTSGARVEIADGEADTRREGMIESLLHRSNPAIHKLTDQAKHYRSMSLLDMCRFCLEANNVRTFGMSKDEMVRKSIQLHLRGGVHTSSDFPEILGDSVNRTLRAEYEQAPRSFGSFVREVEASDFREISRTQLGDAPELELLPEGGEVKYGTIGEAAEKYALATYAKGIRIGRKAIVNDDLDAFTQFPRKFGQRSAEKEADLVYLVLLANAALSDAVALFHATHNNLNYGTGAAALDADTLSDMRLGMRKQTGLDGLRITVRPSVLLVPPELETSGNLLITQVQPNQTSQVNEWAFLQLAVEQRLSDTSFHASASATAHYLTAMAAQMDIIELAKLAGEMGPVIESEEMFDVEGMKLKARIDLGAKAIDFRGLQKNDGA